MNIRDNYKPFKEGGEGEALLVGGRQRELKPKQPGKIGKLLGTSPYMGTRLTKQ
jgi:hypothetical protein